MEKLIGDDTYDPSKNIENLDTIKYIYSQAKETLSCSEMEVYDLLVKGYKYTEIAEILNKSLKQVDNTIQRIKIKLKKINN